MLPVIHPPPSGTKPFDWLKTDETAVPMLPAARDFTSAMLGIEVDEEGLPDAVGEITNMIAGAFRTRMAAFQDAWAISVPTVTVGSDFYIKPISTGDRVIVRFTMDAHELFVELIITPDAEAAV